MEKQFIELEKALLKNGFKVKTFDKASDAKEDLLSEINSDESVGIGGSMSIDKMDIYDDLRSKCEEVYWHLKKDVPNAAVKAMNTDNYITSTNAITMDGKLVNMDGNGNRVASMIYGHKNVYIVVGKNKICKDYEEARDRIRNVAGPLNAKRLNLDTPCVHTGKCSDCDSPQRICNAEVITHKNPSLTNTIVYLIDEELGF